MKLRAGRRGDLEGHPLSARQEEIIALAARGYTQREIADVLGVSVSTIKMQGIKIREKTGYSIKGLSELDRQVPA